MPLRPLGRDFPLRPGRDHLTIDLGGSEFLGSELVAGAEESIVAHDGEARPGAGLAVFEFGMAALRTHSRFH